MICNNNWTCEKSLPELSKNEISNFWQTGTFANFLGIDQISIEYAYFIHNKEADSLVIVSGRSEGYLKYQEMAYDFYNKGFNVFLIDHRGQGLSQRLLDNHYKGYVAHFDDYAKDLANFINKIVEPLSDNKPLILAHSMGGAISIRLMQLYPKMIKASVLSSPMIAINSGGIPISIAKCIINIGNKINALVSNKKWYFLGQKGYQAKPFENNPLTYSNNRYKNFIELYEHYKKLQLGGVTFHWLAQALYVNKAIFKEINKLETPIMVLQASEDTIVDNSEQNRFCQAASHVCINAQPLVVEAAKHEIFFEKDEARSFALSHAFNWLKQHTN